MASCKDCIHYEICEKSDEAYTFIYEPRTLERNEKINVVNCPYFINRAKFIGLPCDVGGNVYTISGRGEIKSFKIVCIKTTKSLLHFNPEHIQITLGCDYPNKGLIWFDGDKMKNVYFSYEEVEQALKERNNAT